MVRAARRAPAVPGGAGELAELVGIYQTRGLSRELAEQVAVALHVRDPLEAHLRDELGHSATTQARPVQAALASSSSFTAGGLVPFAGMPATGTLRLVSIVAVTVVGLAVAGMLGARAAGSGLLRPTLRVVIGGGAAMLITALVGRLAHVAGI